MTVVEGRVADLLCDRCARLLTGRLDESAESLRERAASRGWAIFEARDLCTRCAVARGL